MKKLVLVGFVIYLVIASIPSFAFTYDWKVYNGHEYALTSDWQPWLLCEAEAVSVGGHLATINDELENTWLTDAFYGTATYNINNYEGWFEEFYSGAAAAQIGFHYLGTGDTRDLANWGWSSGEPVTFLKLWQSDFDVFNGYYAYLCVKGCWIESMWGFNHHNDMNSPRDGMMRGIIEREIAPVPEPATLAVLLAFAPAGLMLLKKKK